MHHTFYLRRGTAYIPRTANTEAGYWLMIEPVYVEPVPDTDALRRILLQVFEAGNPVVAEALENIREGIAGCLEARAAHGMPPTI